jgi:HSP20 family molecular chaperone IbpA
MATQMDTTRRNNGVENVKQRAAAALIPNVDVYENPSEILLVVDLPGISKEGLQIDLDKDQLVIEARRRTPHEHRLHSQEFRAADYRRSFAIPVGIDRDKVDAELKAGVLTLRLPKSDALRPRQIQIRAS